MENIEKGLQFASAIFVEKEIIVVEWESAVGKGLFVVGTGTDVGKTYVTALMLKQLFQTEKQVGYYKAAVSGNDRDEIGKLIPGDALFVKNISGINQDLDQMCSYVYERAVSPHLAARIEGNPVELKRVREDYERVFTSNEYTLVEGSGGILCPIRFDDRKLWLEDIIRELGLSTVLVADAGLGTINNVGLTCNYMKSRHIRVKGIIFNHYHPGDVMEEDNIAMCEMLTDIPVVGTVEDGASEIVYRGNVNNICDLFG